MQYLVNPNKYLRDFWHSIPKEKKLYAYALKISDAQK